MPRSAAAAAPAGGTVERTTRESTDPVDASDTCVTPKRVPSGFCAAAPGAIDGDVLTLPSASGTPERCDRITQALKELSLLTATAEESIADLHKSNSIIQDLNESDAGNKQMSPSDYARFSTAFFEANLCPIAAREKARPIYTEALRIKDYIEQLAGCLPGDADATHHSIIKSTRSRVNYLMSRCDLIIQVMNSFAEAKRRNERKLASGGSLSSLFETEAGERHADMIADLAPDGSDRALPRKSKKFDKWKAKSKSGRRAMSKKTRKNKVETSAGAHPDAQKYQRVLGKRKRDDDPIPKDVHTDPRPPRPLVHYDDIAPAANDIANSSESAAGTLETLIMGLIRENTNDECNLIVPNDIRRIRRLQTENPLFTFE